MALGDTLKNYIVGVGVKDNNFTAGLKKMGSSLKDLMGQFGLLAGAAGIGMALKNFTDMGMSISNFSNMTGIAIEDISTLGAALERFGGDSESAKNSLQALQQGLSQAEWGQGNLLQTSAMYGVNIFNDDGSIKNAQQLLMGLADDFQHLTKAQQFTLGQQLGLDESTIQLLQQGKENIDSILSEVSSQGVIDARQAAEAKKFALEINKLKRNLATLGRSLATSVMPVLQELTKILTKIVDFLKQFDAATYAIGAGIVALGWTIKNFGKFMEVFTKNFWKANLPLMALIAGLTLLFLIIEDIYGYFNGKESVFGDMINSEQFQNMIKWLKDMKDNVFGWISSIGDFFGNIFDKAKYIFSNLGTMIKASIINTLNDIIALGKDIPFLGELVGKVKLDAPVVPSFEQWKAEQDKTSANNTQNNNVTVNMAAGSSPYEVEKAAEAGMNKALQLSPTAFVGYK